MPNEEFEKWWKSSKWKSMTLDSWGAILLAEDAFQARQPEIDALIHDNDNFRLANIAYDAENVALKAEVSRLRQSGLKIISDHTERTKEAIKLRQEKGALKAEVERLRDAGSQAHSLLGELLPEATGDAEKEIYRVFDLLRYTLGIYAAPHDAAIEGETK